ncbi:MAG: tetratricopeptide repeat protein [Myxococcota bacterium]|nr:tetratricopeptide repeat protein [Myxococcota bacterium]
MTQTGRRALYALLLVATTFAVYADVGRQDFVGYDDPIYVTQNPHLPAGLSAAGLRWAFLEPYETNWIPLTWLSLLVSYELHGLDPAGYKWTNVALHAASALLLFWALARATGALGRSAFVAAVFALHPLHVESVAWISERKDALAGLFWMLGLCAWVRYAERPGVGRYALALGCLALGLLAKALLVTLPFALLLLDFWPLGRLRGEDGGLDRVRVRRALLEKLPMLPLIGAFAVVTYVVQLEKGAMSSFEHIPLDVRALNAAVAYVEYLGKTLWPVDLAVFYPHPMESIRDLRPLAAGAGLAGVTAGTLALARRAPYLAMGWLWYLGTLVPMIGIVQVGMQGLADRYTYVPMIGVSIAAAWGGRALLGRGRLGRVTAPALAIGTLAALAWLCAAQLRHWRDTSTLFLHALRVTEDNFLAHHTYGRSLLEQGDVDGALEHLAEAVRLRPHWAAARGSLGDALLEAGRVDDAILNLGEAVRARPDDVRLRVGAARALTQRGWTDEALGHYAAALRHDDGSEAARIHALVGAVRMERGEPELAAASYERALALEPDFVEARANLALARLQLGDDEDAVRALGAAIEAGHGNAGLHVALATALAARGREAEAAGHYRRALALDDTNPQAANNLAWLLATARDPALRDADEAVRLARRATDAGEGADPILLDTLAVSLAAAGRFDEAVAVLDRAIAASGEASELLPVLRERRALFAAGRPFQPDRRDRRDGAREDGGES